MVEPDLYKWGEFFEKFDLRIVKQENVGDLFVSTVFLGLDHRSFGDGNPILWETMVFAKGSSMDLDCDQCSGNKEQAEAMHERMVAKVKESQP